MKPPADLSQCDREPVHVPGTVQPHGWLLAVDPGDLGITHASANLPVGLGAAAAVLGRPLAQVLGDELAAAVRRLAADEVAAQRPTALLPGFRAGDQEPHWQLSVHRRPGHVLVEAEPMAPDDEPTAAAEQQLLLPLLTRLGDAASVAAMQDVVVEELRRITGFDRVMLYRFDAEWHGEVLAESRNDRLPAFLGHRFPAGDLPQPARELYLVSRLRQIADGDAEPVPVLARDAAAPPLDLTLAGLRGLSPVHAEYMRNMGTRSSMSVAIRRHGRLWGLLACHSRGPHRLPFTRRLLCAMTGELFSTQLQAAEQASDLAHAMQLRLVLAGLLARTSAAGDFTAVVADQELLRLTAADGAALVRDGQPTRVQGKVPEPGVLASLPEWLAPRTVDGAFATDAFPAAFADGSRPGALPGGLLAVCISPVDRSHLCWFREEVVRTVRWGGDPGKDRGFDPQTMRLHPRRSFDTWLETMRGRSEPWHKAEIDAALALRGSIIDVVVRQSTEKQRLIEQLTQANKELEAFTYTVSHDLRAPFRHARSYAELLQLEKGPQLDAEAQGFVQNILDASKYAGQLVDSMLAFSRMSMQALEMQWTDLAEIVAACQRQAERTIAPTRVVDWRIGPLPVVWGDQSLLRSALQNLLDNAVKYTATRPRATIAVDCKPSGGEWIVSVQDNGVGFDMKYAGKLFGVFQRLHSDQQFAGLGIGLANVHRILQRHGGRVWAEGKPDQGATFFLSLPRPKRS